MIALLSDPDARLVWRSLIVFAVFVILVIILVNAVELNHKHKVLKERRLKMSEERFDHTSHLMAELDRIETDFLLKIEEYRRDFDDAS